MIMGSNEISWLREAVFEAREQCNNARAEVERLSMKFAAANSEIERLTKQNDDLRAKVERLKAEVQNGNVRYEAALLSAILRSNLAATMQL